MFYETKKLLFFTIFYNFILLFRDLGLASLDGGLEGLRSLTINSAANGDGGTEAFEDATLEGVGHGVSTDVLSDLDDLLEGDVARVLDVLDLLAVTRGLLEGLDDAGGDGGHEGDGGNTVLDDELAGDLKTLVFLSGLHDIITDLLGVETEGTDLRGESGSGGHFSTDGADDDDDFSVGVKLRRHGVWFEGVVCFWVFFGGYSFFETTLDFL